MISQDALSGIFHAQFIEVGDEDGKLIHKMGFRDTVFSEPRSGDVGQT